MPLSLIFTQAGDFTIKDDGILGNNQSAIFDGSGAKIFTFVHPADTLNFTTSTTGVNITLAFVDSLGTSTLTVGKLSDAATSPDSIVIKNVQTSNAVVLAANGSITEGGADAAVDIVASSIVFSAGTGVGTGGNAIETQTSVMEAETGTGGINIGNIGTLTIGGLAADVAGLHVDTSGNLSVKTLGSILLNDADGPESVHGGSTSGNVTLIANGFDSDISSLVDQDAINAPGGNISLSAGRDINFGTAGLSFDNDVRARGSLTMNAGRDINLDGFADMASDDFGAATGGGIHATAGRNINFPGINGTDAGMSAPGSAGADVVLTTGAGGVLNLNAGNTFALSSTSGDVTVKADGIVIGATSGIAASGGTVTLNTVTAERSINLGAAESGTALDLQDAELDTISTPNLVIGGPSAGLVSVVAAISPLNAPSLTIRSGGDILLQASVTATNSLQINAGDDIYQTAASVLTATAVNAFVDQAEDDGGTGGTGIFDGTIAASGGVISGSVDADTLNGSAGNDSLAGLGGNDALNGGAGNDTLDGGTGADTMVGGLGNNTYVVNSVLDVVTEGLSAGTDLLQSTAAAYTLPDNVENLTLLGAGSINGTGNTLANQLTGNGGANVLNGGGGADTMAGGGGNDTLKGNGASDRLDGGAGNDSMTGGTGNDVYLVGEAGDKVTELADQGTDTVKSSITYVLLGNVEKLTLTGTDNIDGTGNVLDNVLTGNNRNNTLDGKGGSDTVNGLGGSDTLVWSSADFYDGGAGTDTLKVNGGNLNLTLIEDARILNVETINLENGSSNVLKLSETDVLALSSTTNTLKVLGEAGDSINITDAFTDVGVVAGFHQYTFGSATLRVDLDITNVA